MKNRISNVQKLKTNAVYMVPIKIFVLPQFNTNLPVHCFPKYFLWTACRNLYRTETHFLVKTMKQSRVSAGTRDKRSKSKQREKLVRQTRCFDCPSREM